MIIAVLCVAIALAACLRTRNPCSRMDPKDLRRLNRRSESEYREQINRFE
jgi:hypothetical protein